MNREHLYQPFRDGQLAPQQPTAAPQAFSLAAFSQVAAYGYMLVYDLKKELNARELGHEMSAPSDQVLACKYVPGQGIQFRAFAVVASSSSPPQAPTPAPKPLQEQAPNSGNEADQPQPPPKAPDDKSLARREAAAPSTSLAMPTQQLALPSGKSALQAQMEQDKDTKLVREILLAWKRSHIRTHQDLDQRIRRAHDQIRVRRMVAEVKPDTKPHPMRKGEVSWGDVNGISGYLPFADPLMVVGDLLDLSSPSGRPEDSKVLVRIKHVLLPADLDSVQFFKGKANQPKELHVDSAEVAWRLAQLWTRYKVRLKVTLSRKVPLHGHWFGTVSEVYPEALDEEGRQVHVDWVARELARVTPGAHEWDSQAFDELRATAADTEPQ